MSEARHPCGSRVAVWVRDGLVIVDGHELLNGELGWVVGHVNEGDAIVSFDGSGPPTRTVTIPETMLRRARS